MMQAQTLPPHIVLNKNENRPNRNSDHGESEARKYLLPPHVFVCQTTDCVVFLDARRDQYVGVSGSDAEALRDLLAANSSDISHSSPITQVTPQLVQALDALASRGLLTCESASGRQFREINVELGSCAVGQDAQQAHTPRLTHILAALIAWIGARFDLRFRGVGGTVARLIAQKQKSRSSASATDADELYHLVRIYRVIRPFLYTKRDQCLLHGLALNKFLRHYGFSPTWVIGVSTSPFTAHCWVQYGDCILDDTPEHTLEFTPLAAI
jgi:hypothetical protein